MILERDTVLDGDCKCIQKDEKTQDIVKIYMWAIDCDQKTNNIVSN